ncbi:GGDEF domain-containing protein [Granulicella pectinivorans]|nr:GGDEF domain-containing protein [Granulicella pectinivorans]
MLTPHDGRFFMYPYGATLQLLPMAFCFRWAARQPGMMRTQWRVLGAHFAMMSLSLWAPSLMLWVHWPTVQKSSWCVSGFAATASMCCLLCFSVFSGSSTRSKRLLDAAMTLILCGLNFSTAFSPGPTGFSRYHLQVSMITAVFLLCAAESSRRSVTQDGHRLFAEVTEIYLITRVVMLFLVNIVNAVWLATPRELPFDLFCGIPPLCFALLTLRLLLWGPRRKTVSRPSALWANLLPSMILLATVTFALHGLVSHPILYSLTILLSVACFVLRTHLLYQQMFREQRELLVRTGQLEKLATRDMLTGIGNRRSLELMAFELLETGSPIPSALLLIDTDRFKWVNDTFGHLAGDELLKAIAEEVQEQVGEIEGACCARIGGDEFAALLPHVPLHAAREIAEKIRKRIGEFQLEGEGSHCTVSIGVAAASGRVSLTGLLELADAALYRAKGHGRNAVEVALEDAATSTQAPATHAQRRFRTKA